jgi:hypothetical protein
LRKNSQGIIYICDGCDASVGTHQKLDENSYRKPFGTPADKQLRELRIATHIYFDAIWKNKIATRDSLYKKLAKEMGISNNRCHIGKFNKKQCLKASQKILNWPELQKLSSQYSSH